MKHKLSDEQIKDICGSCINYYDCHKTGFDYEWAENCYNIDEDNKEVQECSIS